VLGKEIHTSLHSIARLGAKALIRHVRGSHKISVQPGRADGAHLLLYG
jgi:hypothetical protein